MTGKNFIYGKGNDEHVAFRCSRHTTLARLKQAAANPKDSTTRLPHGS